MFKKAKERLTHVSKETIKEECKKRYPELIQASTVILLLYLCVKINSKPVIVNVNINGSVPYYS